MYTHHNRLPYDLRMLLIAARVRALILIRRQKSELLGLLRAYHLGWQDAKAQV